MANTCVYSSLNGKAASRCCDSSVFMSATRRLVNSQVLSAHKLTAPSWQRTQATGAECVPALRRVRTDTRSAYFSQTTYWCKSDGSLIAFSPCCPFKFAFMLLYWALNLIETIGDEYVLGEGAVWKRSLSLRRKSVRRFTMTDYDTCFSPLFGRIQSQGLLPKWVDSSMTWSFYSIITDLNCNRGNPEYFITVVLKLFIPSIT